MPRFGLTMEEGTIISWNVQPGEEFEEKDVLYEVETDKTNLEVEADRHGFLREILIDPLSTVPVGAAVAIVSDTADEPVDRAALELDGVRESVPDIPVTPAAEPPGQVQTAGEPAGILAVPRARKLAKELGVDVALIQGSSAEGRISAEDVTAYYNTVQAKPTDVLSRITGEQDVVRTPINGSRKIIAQRLTQSKQEIPHGYCLYEVDMSCALRLKKGLPYKATVSDMAVFCLSRALASYRVMNDSVQDEYIVHNPQINIGLAMDSGSDLVVPVIHNVEKLSLEQIAQERQRLVELAKVGRLSPSDLENATITLSNLGMFGTTVVIPIINPPQGAILGMGEIRRKVVALDDDSIAVRSMMWLSLAGDHRLMDGAYAARFMQEFVRMIESGIAEIY